MKTRSINAALLSAGLMLALAAAQASAAVPKLPQHFVWGVSSSGFQSEGHTRNNNWNYYIRRDNGPNPVDDPKDPYRNSVDFFHRYRSDIALAAKLGVNTYRISINWARVEPRPGKFSRKGLRFYDRVFKRMRHFGIQPLVTLNHWDYPMWVYRQGGWTSPKTADAFVAMTKVIARRYHRVRYWLTFNEEFFFEFVEAGNYPLDEQQTAAMRSNLTKAHRRAYDVIHRYVQGARVSSNYAWPGRGPLARGGDDKFLDAVADKLDYVGLDYYYPAYDQTAALLDLSGGTAWRIPVDPFGMYTALRSMHARFPRLPILITENGVSTENGMPRADGVRREQLLRDTLYWVQRARADDVPVIGYMYWSLTDNYEWGSYTPRLGLYRVDVNTDPKLRRRPTAAVPAYRHLIAARGVPTGYRLVMRPLAANCETESVRPEDRPACRAAATR
jgi:beta-glucosidase